MGGRPRTSPPDGQQHCGQGVVVVVVLVLVLVVVVVVVLVHEGPEPMKPTVTFVQFMTTGFPVYPAAHDTEQLAFGGSNLEGATV